MRCLSGRKTKGEEEKRREEKRREEKRREEKRRENWSIIYIYIFKICKIYKNLGW